MSKDCWPNVDDFFQQFLQSAQVWFQTFAYALTHYSQITLVQITWLLMFQARILMLLKGYKLVFTPMYLINFCKIYLTKKNKTKLHFAMNTPRGFSLSFFFDC